MLAELVVTPPAVPHHRQKGQVHGSGSCTVQNSACEIVPCTAASYSPARQGQWPCSYLPQIMHVLLHPTSVSQSSLMGPMVYMVVHANPLEACSKQRARVVDARRRIDLHGSLVLQKKECALHARLSAQPLDSIWLPTRSLLLLR